MFTSRILNFFSFIFFWLFFFNASISYGFGSEFDLKIRNDIYSLDIKLPIGSKIYWINSDLNVPSTKVDLSRSSNIKSYDLLWPFPKITTEHNIKSYIYNGDLSIPIIIKAIDLSKPVDLKIDLSYAVCANECYIKKQTIERKINIIEKLPLMNHISLSNIDYDSGTLSFEAEFNDDITEDDLEIILTSGGRILDYESAVVNVHDRYYIIFNIPANIYKDLAGKELKLYSNKTNMPAVGVFPETNNEFNQMPLYMAMIFAMIGGFILNFMPCVLPVLALKMMSVTKMVGNYRISFVTTVAGIIFSFWILSFLSITMKDIGVGLGFQQSEFLIVLSMLMVIFISMASSRINIILPQYCYDLSIVKFSSKYIEDFMGGVVATMLSVPCTAPFLGGAMASAILGSSLTNFIIFTSAAIGFSFPYILLIISPKIIHWVPKSGIWMEKLKKGLTVLLVASLMWIISILYNSLGVRGTVGFTMLLLLIKYLIEEQDGIFRNIVLKIPVLLILISGAIYLPKMAHSEDILHEKYIDSVWQEFDTSKIGDYVSRGKVVIVDITADWCLTCKFNKIRLWDRSYLVPLLNSNNVVAMRADLSQPNPVVEQFLLDNHRYGIPCNIIYGPNAKNGIDLPVIPDYDDVKGAIEMAR